MRRNKTADLFSTGDEKDAGIQIPSKSKSPRFLHYIAKSISSKKISLKPSVSKFKNKGCFQSSWSCLSAKEVEEAFEQDLRPCSEADKLADIVKDTTPSITGNPKPTLKPDLINKETPKEILPEIDSLKQKLREKEQGINETLKNIEGIGNLTDNRPFQQSSKEQSFLEADPEGKKPDIRSPFARAADKKKLTVIAHKLEDVLKNRNSKEKIPSSKDLGSKKAIDEVVKIEAQGELVKKPSIALKKKATLTSMEKQLVKEGKDMAVPDRRPLPITGSRSLIPVPQPHRDPHEDRPDSSHSNNRSAISKMSKSILKSPFSYSRKRDRSLKQDSIQSKKSVNFHLKARDKSPFYK